MEPDRHALRVGPKRVRKLRIRPTQISITPGRRYDRLEADLLNGGKPFAGQEYILTTREALVMADYLDKKGLANVRAMYPDFDTCLANVQRMFLAGGWVNPRALVISRTKRGAVVAVHNGFELALHSFVKLPSRPLAV